MLKYIKEGERIVKKMRVMNQRYRLSFKKMACELLPKYENSPLRVANDLGIPIKTFEKWIAAYRKNPYIYNEDQTSYEEENRRLRKLITEHEETIKMLKKAYAFFTENDKSLTNSLQ